MAEMVRLDRWQECLSGEDMPDRLRESYRITIRWYLGWCRRMSLAAGSASRGRFEKEVLAPRSASPKSRMKWRDALDWFFREAPVRKGHESREAQTVDDAALRDRCDELAVEGPGWIRRGVSEMRRRGMAYRTEATYTHWWRRFAEFMQNSGGKTAGEKEMRSFLDYLAVDLRVAAATQKQALNALVFYLREVLNRDVGDFSDYVRAPRKQRIPVILTREELERLFGQLTGGTCLRAKLQYGAGLRISELLRLRIKDVDFGRGQIIIRGGKGDKDRVTALPKALVAQLEEQVRLARSIYELYRADNLAGVWLPPSLARKWPNAGKEWAWFWFWPSRERSVDPRTEIRRRHHVLPGVFQRQFQEGVKAAKIEVFSYRVDYDNDYDHDNVASGDESRQIFISASWGLERSGRENCLLPIANPLQARCLCYSPRRNADALAP